MPLGSPSLLISGPPISGESFFGYILRLTQWNSYDQVGWILQRVGIPFGTVNSRKFESTADLIPLARLTGADPKELLSLLYTGTKMRSTKTGFFFGNFLSQYRIRRMSPKVCPLCLIEADYHRKIWDLAYVTCCPTHKSVLIDTCQNCGKRLSWGRNQVSVCRCGCDWRSVVPTKSSDEDLKLSRQVFKLCGISSRGLEEKSNGSNPLYSLELEDLLSAVTFMSAQYGMVNDTSGKRSLPCRTNKELNEFFSRGFAVFEEWPKRYYEFLKRRCSTSKEAELTPRVSHVFYSFTRSLNRSFSSEKLRFMRIAFEHYLKEHWDSSRLPPSVLRFTGSDPKTKSYLTQNEAIKYLGTTLFWLNKLVGEGRLKINELPGATTRVRVGLIRRSELDEVKKYLNQLVNAQDVVKLLGIGSGRVLELVEDGCLIPLYQPSEAGCWLFNRNDVIALISRIRSKIIPRTNTTDRLMTLRDAIHRVNNQLKLGSLVRAILEDKLVPSAEVNGVGLNRFVFAEGHLLDYLRREQKAGEDLFTVQQVAKRLRVNAGSLYLCIKQGLLTAQILPKKRFTAYRISEDEIIRFESTYVFCGKMVKNLVTSPRAIVDILKEQGVHPIFCLEPNKKIAFIFRRADVEHLDLGELVRAKKSQVDPRGAKYERMMGETVAELLRIDMPALRALVAADRLIPRREIPGENGKEPSYEFRYEDFQKYAATLRQSQGFVSTTEAASILGVSDVSFAGTWGTRLPVTRFPYGRITKYFRLEDVQRARHFCLNTVACGEVAKILGIPPTSVRAKFTPVSGRQVDGFGWNLYLRSDVEKYLLENGVSDS